MNLGQVAIRRRPTRRSSSLNEDDLPIIIPVTSVNEPAIRDAVTAVAGPRFADPRSGAQPSWYSDCTVDG